MKNVALVFSFLFLLTACSAPATLPAPTSTIAIATPFNTVIPPSETPTLTPPATETQPAPTATILSAETLANMNNVEKLNAAPVDMEGYTRSHIGTMNSNWVLYEKDGVVAMAYDLLTGETMKVVEFYLTDGTKLEMLSYKTIEEALPIIANDPHWISEKDISRFNHTNLWPGNNQKFLPFYAPFEKILGFKPVTSVTLPRTGENFFEVFISTDGKGTIVFVEDSKNEFRSIYLDMGTALIRSDLMNDTIEIPTPQP